LTEEADAARVNLAAKVRDEMMIYVPAKGEAAPAPEAVEAAPEAGTESGLQVAVNTATAEELMQVPGIGPAKAKAIIAYREEHGPFQRVEDLLRINGIGEKTLEKLKPYLLVP
jgi:competence protein ComEA